MRKRRLIESFYNLTSVLGSLLALTAFGVTLSLILMDWVSGTESPYLGILTYIVMPVFLMIGLLLIPIGIWRTNRRQAKTEARSALPVFDLNNARHRVTAVVFTVGSMLFIVFTSFGTYHVYEFSESNSFCGETCHTVMSPEFTVYQHSSHAEVDCVTCHVGSGASHYVKAKFNGVNQLLGMITGNFERPIAAPVHNMRTGEEICLTCHAPDKNYGLTHLRKERYKVNKRNSKYSYDLLVNVGGQSAQTGESSGAHWHAANRVEYAPADAKHQVIPWFKAIYQDGTSRTYSTSDAGDPPAERVVMDCMSCHNREAHSFLPPHIAIDEALTSEAINPEVPKIKEASLNALGSAAKASDKKTGLEQIEHEFRDFYEDEDPDLLESSKTEIEAAIQAVRLIYDLNYYPGMNTSWTSHPDNMGHFFYPGCARCHDGQHTSQEDGKVLSYDCNACHSIVAFENPKGEVTSDLAGLEYTHPDADEEDWIDTGCFECHGP